MTEDYSNVDFAKLAKRIPLDDRSRQIRGELFKYLQGAGKGHVGSNFSLVEILDVLATEFRILSPDSDNRLVLSQGWASLVLYYFLQKEDLIDREDLDDFLKFKAKLGGCLDSSVPGVLTSTGSCGHGLPIACGLAKAKEFLKQSGHVFCLMGDGELGEGSVWESFLSIRSLAIRNIVPIIDRNYSQCAGPTGEITALEPLNAKLESFGFTVLDVMGHSRLDLKQRILEATELCRAKRFPLIVSHTVMGKGSRTLENTQNCHWLSSIDGSLADSIRSELAT